MSKEPWLYRSEGEAAIQEAMRLRHRLVPYIYSMTGSKESSYLPLVQPLYWNHPEQDSAYKFPTQYYFGSSLVAAPILRPRDETTNFAKIKAWVPPGRHVDILTGSVYDGDQEIDMYRCITQLPLLAPQGAIIPLDGALVPPNGCPNPHAFEVLVVVGQDGHFDIRESTRDDEQSQAETENQRLIPLDYNQASGRMKVVGMCREWTFRFLSTDIKPPNVRVLIDATPSSQAKCTTEYTSTIPNTVVKVPATSNPDNEIVVELVSDPQLAIIDYSERIFDLIRDFQISNLLKDSIWGIVKASQPTTVKMARLISLGLERSWIGPITELLLADSRRES
jgi:hypothetical protein